MQKNRLLAWDIFDNNLHHRYIDKKLRKKFQTNILENSTGQMILTVVLMVGLYFDNWLT